jgi:predicted ribosomally synthesized peptide with nif11-like leader
MSRENLEKFSKFLMENKERQSKVKSFGDDVDALAAYAQESGYDLSPDELREQRDKALLLIKNRVQKKLRQPDVSLSPGAREFCKFIELADNDEGMSKRLSELSAGAPKEIIAFGKEKGFTFTEQDMQAFGKSILDSSEELSDEELEMVAGGDPTITLGIIAAMAVFAVTVAVGAAVVGLAALTTAPPPARI